MARNKLTRLGIRPAIAGLAVTAALLVTPVAVASAHQGHAGAPGHLPGQIIGSDHHQGRPGHGGHPAAPGR